MRLNLKRKARKRVMTRERQPLLASYELNRVWALDFMRDTLYDGRPFRTLNVIDEGNREALRIECGTSIPSTRVVRVMNRLIDVYGKPEALRLDNGPELTADKFPDWAKEHGVKLLLIQPGKPNQNAFVERFNRSFREEVLDAWLFNAVSEVQTAAYEWLIDYKECRPHESLGDLPPVKFKPRLFNAEVSTSDCPLDREAYGCARACPAPGPDRAVRATRCGADGRVICGSTVSRQPDLRGDGR
jgi:putative transposase